MKDPITLAIEAAGSGPKLAERLAEVANAPITARAIYKWREKWLSGSARAVPAERAVQIESAVGISRHLFRPDIFEAPALGRAP